MIESIGEVIANKVVCSFFGPPCIVHRAVLTVIIANTKKSALYTREAIPYLINRQVYVCELLWLWQVTAYFIYTSDTDTDRFSFIVRLPDSFDIGSELEFAVRYDTGTATHWDNNSGDNYRVKCLTRASFALPSGCNTNLPSLPWQQLI